MYIVGQRHKSARRANHFGFKKSCQAPKNKIFAFFRRQIRANLAHPVRQEGRIMIVTIVGWDAVDAGSADNNGARAYGKDVWSYARFWVGLE